MSQKKLSFEETMDKLNSILLDMENGELTLDESILAYEKAVKAISDCRVYLEGYRRKIEILKKNGGQTEAIEVEDEFC